MTSADDSASQIVVVALADASEEPDVTDDTGAALITCNVQVRDNDPDASDSASISALDAGAPIGRVSKKADGTTSYAPKPPRVSERRRDGRGRLQLHQPGQSR